MTYYYLKTTHESLNHKENFRFRVESLKKIANHLSIFGKIENITEI